jgi:hemerythrin-like domain-containing protein
LLWRRLRLELQSIEAGTAVMLDTSLTQRFVAMNRSHLEFENAHVLPLASQVLGVADIERLGRAMAARRGVPFASPL